MRGAAALLLTLAACHGAAPSAAHQISWTRIATLGDTAGNGTIAAFPIAVVRDSRGRYIVSVGFDPTDPMPRLYDSAGRFIRLLGRRGDGPGEYRQPAVWAGTAESVIVTDQQSGRVTVLDSDFSVVRSFAADGPRSAVRLSSGDFIFNTPYHLVGTPEWTPLMRADAAGATLSAFGADSGGCVPACGLLGVRILTADAHDGIWSAWQAKQLVIEHFDSHGKRIRRFEPAAAWFPRMDSLPRGSEGPPFPIISGLSVDSLGRLWILASVADPHWEAGLGTPVRGEGGHSFQSVADVVRYRDGIIEVRDTTSGALIARRRLPDSPILVPIAPGLIGRPRHDADGWTFIDVWQMQVQ